LKIPWRNGTTHVIFEPLDFIARLVSLVPKPQVNLTRCHGVFAPNSKYRAQMTPAGRAARIKLQMKNSRPPPISACGSDVGSIASIEDPVVIRKTLAHLDDNKNSATTQ
jgi:hypothetical protein